jgi:hypothetical protein
MKTTRSGAPSRFLRVNVVHNAYDRRIAAVGGRFPRTASLE